MVVWYQTLLSYKTSYLGCFIHLLRPACDSTLPPNVLQALTQGKTRSEQNKDTCMAQKGDPAAGNWSLTPSPESTQSFHCSTKLALRSPLRLTPWPVFCIHIGRSLARWLKSPCFYFVLMQTDVSSSSCGGFLLWGRALHFHRKNVWLPAQSPPCSLWGQDWLTTRWSLRRHKQNQTAMSFLIYTVVESVWGAREKQEGAVSGAPGRAGPQSWGAPGHQRASSKEAVNTGNVFFFFILGEEPELDPDSFHLEV